MNYSTIRGVVHAALRDLCKVSVAAKSEAAAQLNCWRCLNLAVKNSKILAAY